MPVLKDWDLALSADQVMWGQGADPVVVRNRRPKLFETAAAAIEEGYPLLEPTVLYRRCKVTALRHEQLVLEDGQKLVGPLIAERLAGAAEVLTAVCTVGNAVSRHSGEIFSADPVRALALEGLGAAATEALGEAACRRFEAMAAAEGMQTSIPLNPGMIGWPLLEAQQQVFSLIDASEIGVELTASGLMTPLKSLSFVLGLGDFAHKGRTCDYCAMQETCRYKAHE